MRRVVLSVGLVAGLLFSAASPADAAVEESGHTKAGGQVRNGSPEAVVVVGRSGEVASWSGARRGGPSWTCHYYRIFLDSGDPDPAPLGGEEGIVDPVVGSGYQFLCKDETGAIVRTNFTIYDPADPFAGAAAAERAMDEARRQLDLPLPEPALNPPNGQLVGVPTWLWVTGAWQEVSASASIGPVAATVTARPVRVEWDMGDGTTVSCAAGTPYDSSRPARDQQSACTHVFTTSSARQAGGRFTVTATVVYAVGWSATTGGGGELGELTRSASVPVTVREAQALIR